MSSPALPNAEQLAAALQAMRDAGHRVTAPRRALLALLTAEHGPFTAEELHGRLEKGMCDVVTIYRSLAALEELHLVRRCDFGDGAYRYEFDAGEHHHHHLICRTCHSVQTLEVCVADGLERIARQMGYADVGHALEIFGVCPDCQQHGPAHAVAVCQCPDPKHPSSSAPGPTAEPSWS